MAKTQRFLPPIPKRMQIYEGDIDVAGVGFRKEEAAKFARSKGLSLLLKPEPSNSHDKNAIMVFGCSSGLFGRRKRHVGYVPGKLAAQIADCGCFHIIEPRLRCIWEGDSNYWEITFDIVGPKNGIKVFRSARGA